MKDIVSIIENKKIKAYEQITKFLGPTVDLEQLSKVAQSLFPKSVKALQELSVFFEQEMLRCRNSEAYFSACLSGAAMIESFLLAICILDEIEVTKTTVFKNLTKKKSQPYENIVSYWTLKEFIPVAEELDWIGVNVVDKQLVSTLIEGYREMLPAAKPGITEESIHSVAQLLINHPDIAFLTLMQNMRNLVHGGRCIRLRKNLASADFRDWAKLVLILIVEIRDCLILRLDTIYQKYMRNQLNSPEGLALFIKQLTDFKNISSPVKP
jgi:hypothetical protein